MTRTSTLTTLLPPMRRKLRSLEDAEQLRLQRDRHVADLVEEHGSAVGSLEHAATAVLGVGECAALMAEQLRFEQRFGNRGADHLLERLAAARRGVVDRPGQQALAGAGLAQQEERRGA